MGSNLLRKIKKKNDSKTLEFKKDGKLRENWILQ